MASTAVFPGFQSPAVGLEAPFEMLVACHERVQRMCDLLARLQQHLRTVGLDENARQAARDVMRYFDLAAPLHHQDEELHVFPPLLAAGSPSVCATVQRLMQDHRQMEQAWGTARAVLALVDEAKAEAWQGLTQQQGQALTDFAGLYARHIADEESIAYPAAQQVLSEAALRTMSADMMRRRGVARSLAP